MNECCNGSNRCCSILMSPFRSCYRWFPRPLSLITTFLIILELTFLALTLAYLIVESRSDAFTLNNCPMRMIIHPIIMICITACNIAVSLGVCSFYNRGLQNPNIKQPNSFYLRRTSQLLCYSIFFWFYYIFILGFIVFIILGQLLIYNQSAQCWNAFHVTIYMDYVLVAIFLFIATFGIFILCGMINENSAEGWDCAVVSMFICNILTCGSCFKNRFHEDGNLVIVGERQFDTEAVMGRDEQGRLPVSHDYPMGTPAGQNEVDRKKKGVLEELRSELRI